MIRGTLARHRALVLAAVTAAGVLVSAAVAAQSQTVYVDNKLQIGLHQDNQLDSTVLRLLPSGTALQVLDWDGDMVQVRLDDGREGWVDGNFVTDSVPGTGSEDGNAPLLAELDEAKAQVATLQAKLATMQARREQDTAGVRERPQGAIPSETLREMQVLAEENQRLKQELSQLQAAHRATVDANEAAQEELARLRASGPTQGPVQGDGEFSIARWTRWQQVLLASALLLAFAAGGWLVDWGTRRRHGGFRV